MTTRTVSSTPFKSSAGEPAAGRRHRSLAETAYSAIEQMIVSRHLPPGAMVSESEIGAELSLGRSPIREAMTRLKAIGFVEVHPRRGILVTQIDVIQHLELLEVRHPLEETIVRCAIKRATDEDMAGLVARVANLGGAANDRDREGYFRSKRELHEAAVHAAYNPTLTATMSLLHAQSRRFWYSYEPTGSFIPCAQLHSTIVAGIAARDETKALEGVTTLFDYLDTLTRKALDRRPIS